MIKVSVLYPNAPGARFDLDYYRDSHMPMVKQRMGDRLHHYTIDRGLSAGAPGSAPAWVCVGTLYCESVEAFQAGFGPHTKEIMGDIPNYTDCKPVLEIAEVVVA